MMSSQTTVLTVAFACAFAGMLKASEVIEVGPVTDKIILVVFRDGKAIAETLGNGANGKIEQSPLDTGRAELPGSFIVTSKTHSAFAKGVKPVKVGRKAKGTEFARVGKWNLGHALTHWIYLVLPVPLKSGETYTVDVGTLATGTKSLSFVFDEKKTRSETVHVNQIGYAPSAPQKYAYLSQWMGTLGPLSLDEYAARSFHVVNIKTGKAVFTGKPKLRKRKDKPDGPYKMNHAGSDIWELDFSAFKTTGEYVIAMEGVGCSFSFKIAPDVYREAFQGTMKGLYHQRCGIELKAPYTKWPRKRCHHPADRTILQSTHQKMTKGNAFKELPATATKEKVQYWGGYHDAGDWDRGAQHLLVSDCLFAVFELAPDKFIDKELNLPESGNGIPDIVDEARFNLDCFKRMQKPHGGVCGGLESSEHPAFGDASWTDSLALFAYAPDPDASFRYAATACKLQRILKQLGKEKDAKEYLASAVKAWTWALANGGQNDKTRDVRLHAAAALFRSTGKPEYQEAFKQALKIATPETSLWEYRKHDQRWGVWMYALTKQPGIDKELQKRLQQAVMHYARVDVIDTAKRRGRRYGYNWWKPFGHTGLTTPNNMPLIFAHAVSGEERFLTQMYLNCDNMLGGNPLNICWVTGLGHRPCEQVLHIDSKYDTIDAPVPGIIPYGPTRYRPTKRDVKKGLAKKASCNWTHSWGQDSTYPHASKWPGDELWYGNYMAPISAEFTVTETIGPAAAAYAYLCAHAK